MEKRFIWIILALGILLFGLFRLGSVVMGGGGRVTERTIVLERVRALDRLASVERVYTGVWRSDSSVGASGVWELVPGADAVSRAVTANSAVVSYVAKVQAGVSLGEIEVTETADKVIVKLPAPWVEAYPGKVSAESVRRGLLWRDENATLKAERSAVAEARRQAVEAGIREEALRSAAVQLNELLDPVVEKELEFRSFDGRVLDATKGL